ncbi:MAG: heavy metal translocating P-type ATPase [Syntrophobacteraceae bacterium]
MENSAFRIKGMCCGEEIAMLKAEIAPLVGGAERLSFDLLESKMIVSGNLDGNVADKIMSAVAKTGMQAVLADEKCASGVCALEEGIWAKNGRLFTCAASGLLMVIAFLIEAVQRGSIIATLTEGGAAPVAAISFYVAAILAGGWFIFPKALYAAKKLRPDMNLLMIIAVLGAVGLGEWLEAASVSFLFSLALLLESWSVGKAKREITSLLHITPPMARFLCPHDGQIEEKPVGEISVGATVVVRPGERIPLDGIVTKGATAVNQAPITGESARIPKGPGDEVFAGTINEEGAIEFRSTRPAADTTLSRIIRMVQEGRSRRAPAEQWVEKFARVYTPAMMLVALAIMLLPPLFTGGGWAKSFYEGLVVLVIACPCALVISTPVTIVAGLSSAARNGVLIKGGAYLEAPAHLKAVAFDKTGTLTYGQPAVNKVTPIGGHSVERLIANAAALETHSTHPLARAILRHAEARGISPSVADSFTILPGEGAQGTIQGKTYWIGSHRMLERLERENQEFHEAASRLEAAGNSLVAMWCDDHICGLVSVSDEVRPQAREAVAALKALGLETIMFTGDNRKTAELIARATGIDDFHPELLPEDKVRLVSELKEKLGAIAMVGDGVNDAPAMAAATVGIAMGAIGSDAAIETADIALMTDDLSKLPWLIRHSKRTLSVIRQNILFALLLKLVFIGLAAAGIATLWGAIAADMGASLLVIFNGMRLLRTTELPGDKRYPAACRSELACMLAPSSPVMRVEDDHGR